MPPSITECVGCKESSTRGLVCSACRPDYTLAGVISAGRYSHPVFKRGVQWLKFKGVRSIAPDLASLILPHVPLVAPLEQLVKTAVLVPIPLHKSRLRSRGFNQSEDIALAISRYSGIPVENLLARTRSTWTQSHLPASPTDGAHDLRSQNLTNAFSPIRTETTPGVALDSPGVEEARNIFILIDDVTTTGATLEAAAKVLHSHLPAGKQVWAATIARG